MKRKLKKNISTMFFFIMNIIFIDNYVAYYIY